MGKFSSLKFLMSSLSSLGVDFTPLNLVSGTLVPETTLPIINAANTRLNERGINLLMEVKGFRLLQKFLTSAFTLKFLFLFLEVLLFLTFYF